MEATAAGTIGAVPQFQTTLHKKIYLRGSYAYV